MNDSNALVTIGLAALVCLIPLALLGFTIVMLLRMARGALETDVDGLRRRYERLQARRPQDSREALLLRLVSERAAWAGVVGALTGLGGVFTLPLGIAIDLALTLRMQINLVTFIEQMYTGGSGSPFSNQIRSVIIMTGSGRAARWTTAALVSAVSRLLSKSLAKVLPLIGAVISFAVNFAIMQAVGRAAVSWYAAHARPERAPDAATGAYPR